jgi:phosphatidylglycerophosphatase GEP4
MANRMAKRLPALKDSSLPELLADSEKATEKSQRPTPSGMAFSTKPRAGPLSVWTRGVWEREGMGMRYLESSFMQGIRRYVTANNGVDVRGGDVSWFLKPESASEEPPSKKRMSLLSRLWNRVRRT